MKTTRNVSVQALTHGYNLWSLDTMMTATQTKYLSTPLFPGWRFRNSKIIGKNNKDEIWIIKEEEKSEKRFDLLKGLMH